ncbi:chemotaxis protein CheC [Candidatus Methanoperedens nitratireducens]|uniref:CheC, inhibitor of MCP methylation n=1 Tax=Candidatus Methanoperedens nitratireducens TaxID=1392998 RepID=A0A284VHY6_9EURY|nr:chemotaxis protein CheC [Candidatus Methanoperedens nitroreducens]SNQ58878.1 CheC, inhibitor of MCP methylation [Candidatus Methanoperedens nitroreducens]
MEDIKVLTDFQYDALKEVGNIGIGNATTSLSQMVNKKVDISLPDLKLVPIIKVPIIVKNAAPVVGIIQQLKGDSSGFLVLLLSKDSAKLLIKLVLGQTENNTTFNEMEQSVLKELGNIMNGTYISSLSNFLGIALGLLPPNQVYDMSDAIINQIVGMMSMDVEDVLFMRTEFTVNSEKIDGRILIFTDSDSLTRILGAINKLLGK